jgi:hypothetical protein
MLKSEEFQKAALTIVMQLRFADAVKGNEADVARAAKVVEEQLRRLIPERCGAEPCTNQARYTSGMCGICDMRFGDGTATRYIDG